MEKTVDQMKKLVSCVEMEKQKGELPEWAKGELQIVRNRLSALLA